jgi:protein-tyrosine phosphatase
VPGEHDDRFAILFVCTANVCRSVIAAHLAEAGLRARLGDAASLFCVASAGTAGPPGAPLHPYTARVLRQLGARAGGFTSRRLTGAGIDAADLILCAGREHLEQVMAVRPVVSRRAYLLKEFARLAWAAAPPVTAPATLPLATVPQIPVAPVTVPAAAGTGVPGRARGVVTQAARLRGRVPYVEPAEDEIPDPKPTQEGFTRCASEIQGALRVVLDSLCGPPPGGTG